MTEELFNYSIHSRKENSEGKVYIIPTLDELILNEGTNSPYNKSSFIHYLSQSHCLENLEFILELNEYTSLHEENEQKQLWALIYRNFLVTDSSKELNLPYSIIRNFQEEVLPGIKDLVEAKSMIYEILLDSYNEFIKHVKSVSTESARRKSEITAPEAIDDDLVKKNIPRSVSLSEQGRYPCPSDSDPFFEDDETTPEDLTPTTKSRKSSQSNSFSNGSNPSSRGSSIGSIVESLKHNDYIGWKKTIKKLKIRRFSNEE